MSMVNVIGTMLMTICFEGILSSGLVKSPYSFNKIP